MGFFDRFRLVGSTIKAAALFFLLLASAGAGQATLMWDSVPDSTLGGYWIYYGQTSKSYLWAVDVGNKTSFTLYNLTDGQTYYFAIKAYNNTKTAESGFSNEVGATINSIDISANTGVLITHYYQSILGRSPDAAGIAFWQGEINRAQGLGMNIQEAFRVMASLFFTSDEYIGKHTSSDQYVTDLYTTFLNRSPDAGGLSYWAGQLAAGLPRSVVMFTFMFMPEFTGYMQSLLGDAGSRGEVSAVVDFYRGFFNRLPDSSGFSYWLGRFRSAQCQGSSAVVSEVDSITRQFLTSQEYSSRLHNDNRDYVADLYFAFLRRGGDLIGFDFWVSQLNAGLRSRDRVRQDFIQSPEFQARVLQIINDGCFN